MPNLVFFLVLLFLLASYLRVDFFFTIIYLLAAVFILSRLWMVRAAANLAVERRFVDRAFLGDEVQVELRVHNRGWLPVPWVLVHESLPVDLVSPPLLQKVLGLGPGEEQRLLYSLNCRRRGYYPLGPLQFSTGDLLGIHESRQRQIEAEYLIIYPRVLPLERLGLPTQSPLVVLRAQSPLFEDPARIMGVRDYEVGDSPRRIHWTATASAGRLLVKQYEPAIARDTFICLDLGKDAYDPRHHFHATELAIVTAASIANHVIVREGLPVGLATHAWDPLVEEHVRFSLPLHKGRGHLMSLLEVLARVERAKKESRPFGDLLRQESLRLPWGATLVVISGREDPALFETLAQLRRSGFSVALILVQAPLISVPLQGRAELLNIPLYRVWSEEELEVLS